VNNKVDDYIRMTEKNSKGAVLDGNPGTPLLFFCEKTQ